MTKFYLCIMQVEYFLCGKKKIYKKNKGGHKNYLKERNF